MLRRNALWTFTAGLACAGSARAYAAAQREAATSLPAGALLHRFSARADDGDSVDFTVVQFESARCTLRVIDQPDRSNAGSLADAMGRTKAIAGVNGGFFTPGFEPLGLTISQGRRLGAWQKSSLLGGVIMVKKGRPTLVWRDEFQDSAGITELLQAGPRLVNNGRAVTGLQTNSSRARTFIATDNAGRWLLGICQYTTLAGLAGLLATPGLVPGMEIVRALNFDGGKSTGIWARTSRGAVVSDPEFSTVRNFVAIVPRSST